MRQPFNKIAALGVFIVILIAYACSIIADLPSPPHLIGSLIYGIMGVVLSIISGITMQPSKLVKGGVK